MKGCLVRKTDKAFRRRRRLLNRIKRLYLKETGQKIDRSQRLLIKSLDYVKHQKDQSYICKELRDLKMSDRMIINTVVEFNRYLYYAKSLEGTTLDINNDEKVKATLDYIWKTSDTFKEFIHNCGQLPDEIKEHRYYKNMLKNIIHKAYEEVNHV